MSGDTFPNKFLTELVEYIRTEEDTADWAATLLVRFDNYNVAKAVEACKDKQFLEKVIIYHEFQEGTKDW